MREFSLGRLRSLLESAPAGTFFRHDVDVSLPAALAMAELEAELGVSATYYLMTTSLFYTPVEAIVAARELFRLGHRFGIHLDLDETDLRDLLDGSWAGVPVSFHHPPQYVLWRDFDGLFENAFAKRWQGRYLSDSRGVFLHGDPEDRFAEPGPWQLCLHPEWWFEPDWIQERLVTPAVYETFFREPLPEAVSA